MGALICFIVSGGGLEDLVEGHHPAIPNARTMRDNAVRTAQNTAPEELVATADDLLSDDGQNASYLALTSLYAGTEPTASRYKGKVGHPSI